MVGADFYDDDMEPGEPPAGCRASLAKPVVFLVGGVLAALIGLLPWLVSGLRLPLQNLWAVQTLPDDMPIALLPFDQYDIVVLFGLLVLPGGLVGLMARRRLHREAEGRSAAPELAIGGVLVVQFVAFFETVFVVVRGLTPGRASLIYTFAISAVAVVSIVIGVAIALMVARGSRGLATIAFAGTAVALGSWVPAFLSLCLKLFFDASSAAAAASTIGAWAPAVVTGVALAWCGWRPGRRRGAWVGALLVLWVGGAVLDGLLASVSSRVYLGDFARMAEAGLQVFASSLATHWTTLLVAAGLGVIGCLLRVVVGGRPDRVAEPMPTAVMR